MMQLERSKKTNSRASACGDMGRSSRHPFGKAVPVPGSDLSPPVATPFHWTVVLMCRSLRAARPHCISAGCSTGVLKVMYWTEFRFGVCVSVGHIGMVIQSWVGGFTAVYDC